MTHPINMAGHQIERFDVPGGAIVAARHWIDRTVCAVVIHTEWGDYLSVNVDEYGPIPEEIVMELVATSTAHELYGRAIRLGFKELLIKFVQV